MKEAAHMEFKYVGHYEAVEHAGGTTAQGEVWDVTDEGLIAGLIGQADWEPQNAPGKPVPAVVPVAASAPVPAPPVRTSAPVAPRVDDNQKG